MSKLIVVDNTRKFKDSDFVGAEVCGDHVYCTDSVSMEVDGVMISRPDSDIDLIYNVFIVDSLGTIESPYNYVNSVGMPNEIEYYCYVNAKLDDYGYFEDEVQIPAYKYQSDELLPSPYDQPELEHTVILEKKEDPKQDYDWLLWIVVLVIFVIVGGCCLTVVYALMK